MVAKLELSPYRALKSIKNKKVKNVLIHDAARPDFSIKLLDKLIKELKNSKSVVPGIKPTDTVKFKNKNLMINLDRDYIYLTQTPQAFDYKELYKLQSNKSSKVTDDANIFIRANKKVKIINGEDNNKKITKKIDINNLNQIKYGIGFDVHRLVPKRKLYLGGIKIKSKLGTLDTLMEILFCAITDPILEHVKWEISVKNSPIKIINIKI